ncbi:MAG: ferrous iron transport protein A [Nitratireductor sp.]|nr:ferrous iron transport protein A [Nitratireductor sp.]
MDAISNKVDTTVSGVVRLGDGARGMRGVVVAVGTAALADLTASRTRGGDGEFDAELERRLLEIGFVEGAQVEILHEGLFGRDPIAVKVDTMRVALRRHEARAILVRPEPGGAERRS